MIHSKGKLLLQLAALVALLSLEPAPRLLALNAPPISPEQAIGLMPTYDDDGTGTIILKKQTDPAGGTGFGFTIIGFTIPGVVSFSLDDGATLTIPNAPAFTYTVTEGDPTVTPGGYDLTGLTCEDPDGGSSIDLGARTATIDLDAEETITCTFTNTYVAPVPVGGVIIPVNRLGLLAPWLGLAALASLSTLTVVVVRRRRG